MFMKKLIPVVIVILCTVFISCRTNPKPLPPLAGEKSGSVGVDEYENSYINNPEMYPRELSMPARRELLRINWAMLEAFEKGKQNVRIIAPPLQLTGDPNVDINLTHEVVVVADDLEASELFTNKYDIRVGPRPSLAVIRQANTSTSLKEADKILAESTAHRLALDEQTLLHDQTYGQKYLPAMTNHVNDAQAAFQKEQGEVTARVGEITTLLSGITNRLNTISNAVIFTNQAIATANSNLTLTNASLIEKRVEIEAEEAGENRTNELARLNGAAAALTNQVQILQASIAAGNAGLAERESKRFKGETEGNVLRIEKKQIERNMTASEARLEAVRSRLRALAFATDKTGAAKDAIESLRKFWSEWAENRKYYSAFSKSETPYDVRHAVVVAFRAQALAGLPHVTIDVLRKREVAASAINATNMFVTNKVTMNTSKTNVMSRFKKDQNGEPTGSSDAASGTPVQGSRDPSESLDSVNGYIGRTKSTISALQGLLLADSGLIEAKSRRRRIVSYGARLAEIGHSIDALLGLNATRTLLSESFTNKFSGVSEIADAAEWVESLNRVLFDISENLKEWQNDALRYGGSSSGREKLFDGLLDLRNHLARVQALIGIVSGGDEQKSAEAESGVVANILAGNQAIFKLPVIRGVIVTTAYLLPDDGAAQLFGQDFADQFYAAQVTFRNPHDKNVLIYGNTMRLVVRMNALKHSFELSEDGQLERQNFWATYEPMDFDSIRRMIVAQQDKSWQRRIVKAMDLALMAGGGWVGVGGGSRDFTRAFGVISALSPNLKERLEANLKDNAENFRAKGLDSIEEIEAQGVLTRYVFLPKGPIYGNYAYDASKASALPLSSKENRWAPFSKDARDFGSTALHPAYIHDIRREEIYIEGKRILNSDPLTSSATP